MVRVLSLSVCVCVCVCVCVKPKPLQGSGFVCVSMSVCARANCETASHGYATLKKLCFFAFKFFAFKRSAGEGFRRIGPAGAALLRDVRL